jgi:hypothetical protein
MIKVETIGMIQNSKINPTITSQNDVENYTFLTVDGDLYLITNTVTGDNAYREGVTFKAGEYLNGYLVKAFEGEKLVVDEKHIAYGDGQDYEDITDGTIFTVDEGKLKTAVSTPESGVYFKVTEKTTLTGKAVKVKVYVAGDGTTANSEGSY